MAKRSEAARSLATKLLEDPGLHQVTIWSAGDEWAWSLEGQSGPGGNYVAIRSEVVDNGDADPTSDPQDIGRYAAEIESWMHTAGS